MLVVIDFPVHCFSGKLVADSCWEREFPANTGFQFATDYIFPFVVFLSIVTFGITENMY